METAAVDLGFLGRYTLTKSTKKYSSEEESVVVFERCFSNNCASDVVDFIFRRKFIVVQIIHVKIQFQTRFWY